MSRNEQALREIARTDIRALARRGVAVVPIALLNDAGRILNALQGLSPGHIEFIVSCYFENRLRIPSGLLRALLSDSRPPVRDIGVRMLGASDAISDDMVGLAEQAFQAIVDRGEYVHAVGVFRTVMLCLARYRDVE